MNGIGEIEDDIPSLPEDSILQLEKLLAILNYKYYSYPSNSSKSWNIHISDGKSSIDINSDMAKKLYNDTERMIHLLFLELTHNIKDGSNK